VHPDLKARGSNNVLDANCIANILSTFNSKGGNWLLLFIDVNEELGTSLRIAAYGGFRLLVVVRATNIRKFYQDNWLALLLRLADLDDEQV